LISLVALQSATYGETLADLGIFSGEIISKIDKIYYQREFDGDPINLNELEVIDDEDTISKIRNEFANGKLEFVTSYFILPSSLYVFTSADGKPLFFLNPVLTARPKILSELFSSL
jgi:hypothetical protein